MYSEKEDLKYLPTLTIFKRQFPEKYIKQKDKLMMMNNNRSTFCKFFIKMKKGIFVN